MRLIARAALGALAVATLGFGIGTPANAARIVVTHPRGVAVTRSYYGGAHHYYRHGRGCGRHMPLPSHCIRNKATGSALAAFFY
jgi:hypothetical protein